MSLFHRDINTSLAVHIYELKRFGFLPKDWMWESDKVSELEKIDDQLMRDLFGLHNEHSISEEKFLAIYPFLKRLHQELKSLKGKHSIAEEALEAREINQLIAHLDDIFKRFKMIQRRKKKKVPKKILNDYFLNLKYKAFEAEMLKKDAEGKLHAWFVNFVNGYLGPRTKISLEDIGSLKLITHSDSLARLQFHYGHTYHRPVFSFNRLDIQIIREKMDGTRASAGCTIMGEAVDKNPLTKGLRIIITSGSYEFMNHELRHTIDAYIDSRKSVDRIIEEFIAFYGDIVIPPKVISTKTERIGKRIIRTWTEEHEYKTNLVVIGHGLKTKMYHDQCSPNDSFDSFCRIVDHIRGLLQILSKEYTVDEIDRILYHARTIQDIREYFDSIKNH